jgi:hypothetical protein
MQKELKGRKERKKEDIAKKSKEEEEAGMRKGERKMGVGIELAGGRSGHRGADPPSKINWL